MREFGEAVTIMGGGDIVPAMDRGLLDGAEFNNPSSDCLLGFPDVSKTWMLRSYHQDCEAFEIIFNKTKHDSLPEEFQAILDRVGALPAVLLSRHPGAGVERLGLLHRFIPPGRAQPFHSRGAAHLALQARDTCLRFLPSDPGDN
ncbi:type 2 periplasmic-binding domain-containing protein [Billgrantia diversa]|uniref:hypothetical protein n=1 Tax=Halomonas sp. MCCC 1A13316 TaxID=2733487 RepID=UPI0018D32D8C|nr:hypothetical protein [Halomonas sp. MCCC 1A13316]